MQQFPLLPLDKTMNLMKSIPGIIVRFQPSNHLKTFFEVHNHWEWLFLDRYGIIHEDAVPART
jgi:hypothetical protein